MALAAGNYIIYSAVGDTIALQPTGRSKANSAHVTAGGFSEIDNECYWNLSVVAVGGTNYNKINNIFSNKALSRATSNNTTIAVQNSYKAATGLWDVVSSGNTRTIDGKTVNTVLIVQQDNANAYLTSPAGGGDLFVSARNTANSERQEFYFEASTYYDKKLATPNTLRNSSNGNAYIIHGPFNLGPNEHGPSVTFKPQWKSAKSNLLVYEIRHRYRCFDMDGQVAVNWTQWTNWTAILAQAELDSKKKFTGVMKSVEYTITTPSSVDNVTYSRAEIEVQVRATNAKNLAGYSKTGKITHSGLVDQVISLYCKPKLTISYAIYSPDGLALTYITDYTIANSSIRFNFIKDSTDAKLVENYTFTGQQHQGDLYLNSDELYFIPEENENLKINATITEENGFVNNTFDFTLRCNYDSNHGLTADPIYVLTDRYTVLAFMEKYDIVQCYMANEQLNGEIQWVECTKLIDSYVNPTDHKTYSVFEIVPPFNRRPNIMWVCVASNGQWTSSITSVADIYITSNAYSWYWLDEYGEPHVVMLKYQAGEIMKPGDSITLSATQFITTAREYPVYRYGKTIKRSLDIEGVILNTETDDYCTKEEFEQLAIANHCIYRQPDGKWYQVAIQSVTFTRDVDYVKVQIKQEAETR